nr:FliC/FljB family flagellin [Escherichia coli]
MELMASSRAFRGSAVVAALVSASVVSFPVASTYTALPEPLVTDPSSCK